jgi:hypothetical protein
VRRALVVALVAACGGKAPERPAAPATKAAPAPGPAPAADAPYDDVVFVTPHGKEHLVIESGDAAWTFTSDYKGGADDGSWTSKKHTVVTVATDGGLTHVDEEVVGTGTVKSRHVTVERSGDELVVTTGTSVKRVDVADLYHDNIVGQLAAICLDPTPSEWSVVGENALEVGDGEQVEDILRVPVWMDYGPRDLYCRDGRLLAMETIDGVWYREDDKKTFQRVRRPPPTPPARPAGILEIDRTVDVAAGDGVEAATLSCTFVAPGDAQRHPAVALVVPYAHADRDGDLAAGDRRLRLYRYRALAYALAGAGIASLRCDGRGGSEDVTTTDVMAADAAGALAALADDETIDPKRLGYVGVTDSASIAPVVWRARKPRAMVVFHPQDGSLEDALLRIYQKVSDRVDDSAARRAFDAFAAGDPLPSDTPALVETAIRKFSPSMRSWMRYDGVAESKKVERTAVLIVAPTFPTQLSSYGYDGDPAHVEAGYRTAKGKKQNVVEVRTYDAVDPDLRARTAGDEGRAAVWWTPRADDVIADMAAFFAAKL